MGTFVITPSIFVFMVRQSMFLKHLGSLAVVTCLIPSLSWAVGQADYSLDLIALYNDTPSRILVDGKSASFKTGGGGLKFDIGTEDLGSFFTMLGGGYSPSQSAAFSGVELSGPADSRFHGGGYSYQYPYTDRLNINFVADYVSYEITGDLEGEALALPVTASVDSTISMLDVSVALRFALAPEFYVVVGAGVKDWSLDARADAVIGDSLTASTDVVASGSDPLFYIGAEFDYRDVPVEIYYRRSEISVDNSVPLNGLDIRVLLMEF
jgi:hypothetical protein